MKLLVTGAWRCTEKQLNDLKELGNEIVFMQNERNELPCAYEDVDAVICNGLFLYHPIEKFVNLRYIQLTSAGFDRIPMDYVSARDIKIHNARGVYSIPMAEYAVSGVLQLYKQAQFFNNNQKERAWVKHREILELFGKTVCIVGCGNVGTECAKRFGAFGCRVIGVDLFPTDNANYDKIYPICDIDESLAIADVVVLTLPLTDETRHMMSTERFTALKHGTVLVNIARGAIIDEKALLNALDEKLYGAVLDVFEEEPLSEESPLWEKKNVIITPHNSFVGEGNNDRLWNVIMSNLENPV